MNETFLQIIGGLGIFLFAIYEMGESLKGLAGSKLRVIIEKATGKVWKGILIGALLTALIQSSSSFVAIVIALVSAGLMGLNQAIPLILGSNFGTTITSILIGFNFGFEIKDISLIIAFIGAVLIFFFKQKRVQAVGGTLLGFGLLFFGLDLMGTGLGSIFQDNQISSIIKNVGEGYTGTLMGVGVGTIITGIIQSSSAFIGIVQEMFALRSETGELLNILSPLTVIGLIMGSNVGTTITGLLSSLSGSRNAKRAAIINVILNLTTTIIFLILLIPFNGLIDKLFNNLAKVPYFAEKPEAIVAVVHVGFNASMVLILSWFTKYLVRLIEKIIPLTKSEKMISSVDNLQVDLIEQAPSLALANAKEVIDDMAQIVQKMYNLTKEYIKKNNFKLAEEVLTLEEVVDNYDNKIHDYLAKLSKGELTDEMIKKQAIYFDTIRDLERIADHTVNLIEFMQERYEMHYEFSEDMMNMIDHLMSLITNMVNDSVITFKDNDKKAAARIRATEPQIDELEKKYRRDEVKAITSGETELVNKDLHFVDILANLERIGDHTNNIADNILFNSIHNVVVKINDKEEKDVL